MTVEDFKAQGNAAFSAGKFDEAVSLFSKAIEQDPSNHVLYSNRSAAFASLKKYKESLTDAEKTVSLKSDWAKGYSRKGAALHGLGNYKEALEAYEQGLKIDPNNALLKKGLEEVRNVLETSENPLLKLFGPDVWAKMAANPRLAPFLQQPDVVQKIREIQANPNLANSYLQDPKMMQVMVGLMGLNADVFSGGQDEDVPMKEANEQQQPTPSTKKEPEPEPEPEPELSEEEKEAKAKRAASDAEKAKGNEAYKAKKFEEALAHYEKSWELDKTNIPVLTNKSAVLFEMGDYDGCIKVCEEAVELGRDLRADFKIIARAFGRMGNAYAKKDDLDNAIRNLEKSLSEHRTPDVLTRLRELEKLKKQREIEAYRDPKLADEARERGNELFKNSNFSDAVREYTEAIKRNDSDAKNYSNRAAAYMKLMAFPEAEKDCDTAIKLDPSFVKAYIRKAAILFAKKEFTKCIDICGEAKEKDTEKKHTAEIDQQVREFTAYIKIMKCYAALNSAQSGQSREEALRNPEVQEILGDPVMQQILQQMQSDPKAAQEYFSI